MIAFLRTAGVGALLVTLGYFWCVAVAACTVAPAHASSAFSCSCAVMCNGLGGTGPLGHRDAYQAISAGAAASMCYSDAEEACMKARQGIVTERLRASCR